MLKMIVATGLNNEIGKGNDLPWERIPEDMIYFREMTLGSVVVMGSNTFRSLPFKNGLPNRYNYVLTSKGSGPQDNGCIHIKDIEVLLDMSQHRDVWVIGGASVYAQCLPYVDEIHWTLVKQDFPDADTYLKGAKNITEYFNLVSLNYLGDKATVGVFKRITPT